MFNVLKPINIGAINRDIALSKNYRTNFQNSYDQINLQSIDRFYSEFFIKNMIERNPKIKKLVQKFNPKMNLNINELNILKNGHAIDTQNISKGIYNNLPYKIQTQINQKELFDAAILHDLGKVLIPKNILNKPAKLNASEFKIMSNHSEISYELLKYAGLNNYTLYLIKNHHAKNSLLNKLFNKTLNNNYTLQTLTTADKYSALTEKRVYKDSLTPKQALTIIYKDVKEGKLDNKIFNALLKYTNLNIENMNEYIYKLNS